VQTCATAKRNLADKWDDVCAKLHTSRKTDHVGKFKTMISRNEVAPVGTRWRIRRFSDYFLEAAFSSRARMSAALAAAALP
jgi:hypothetical protein